VYWCLIARLAGYGTIIDNSTIIDAEGVE